MTEALSPRKRRQALELLSRQRVAGLTEHIGLEVADRRVHTAHVDALIRSRSAAFADILGAGEILAFKIRGQWRIKRTELDPCMDAQPRGDDSGGDNDDGR